MAEVYRNRTPTKHTSIVIIRYEAFKMFTQQTLKPN